MADQTVRVEDYLNDKIQSQADLDQLDALLQSVKEQQVLLRKQLEDAEADHAVAREKSSTHSKALLDHAEAFRKQQMSIDKRMMVISQSETSDDAVRRFDTTMQKLRKLDIAKSYVDLLAEIEQLSAEAKRNFMASPEAALKPYIRLQEIAGEIRSSRPAAEDAAPHLMNHVEGTIRGLWAGMKVSFSADFEKTLQRMKWPPKDAKAEIHFAGDIEQEWIAGVEKLLRLQSPELRNREADSDQTNDEIVLLPLEVMLKPLAQRFRYHFSGDRPTNRRDKPEFFLSHIADLLNQHEVFFSDNLQPILFRHLKGSPLAFNSAYIDSTSALITALLPMVREKLRELLPQVAKDAQLLSHLIHELMSFDSSLRDTWGYDGGHGSQGWKGITSEVLEEWFGRWLEVEKEFALNRYRSIMEQSDSNEIDFESVDAGETKPTKGAMRVNDLVETVTDRYRPLVSFHQKMRFLIDIQISIFDRYHQRLHETLEAFMTATSALVGTFQALPKEEVAQLRGLGGIERLTKIYVSADYLERKMRDWSDDIFFLELWDELQHRARTKDKRNSNMAANLSLDDMAGRTSRAVGTDEDVGALFDETAAVYHRLRVRTEGIIEEQLFSSIRESLRPYGKANPWASLSPSESTTANTISPELDSTVQLLTSYLGLLSKCLAAVPLRRIARNLALQMQTWLWDHVVARSNFSHSGVEQLSRDVQAIWGVFDQYCRQGYGRSSMVRLADALALMSLPASEPQSGDELPPSSETTGGRGGNGSANHPPGAATATGVTLQEAEQRIFMSNEDARQVLEELGLDHLTESEARTVMEKRIELGD